MPLTPKGEKVLKQMRSTYGDKKGEEVFYASANSGKITGVHEEQAREFRKAVRALHLRRKKR